MVADLKETAAYYQASGYDLDWTDFLSIGPDGYEFTKLLPDTEYVGLRVRPDRRGQAADGRDARDGAYRSVRSDGRLHVRHLLPECLRDGIRHLRPAVQCGYALLYRRVQQGAVRQNTPSSIADAFIEMENGYEIDWAGNEYIWTGDVTVDTDADLAMGDLDAGTDYVAVVFGVSTEGVRTTEVASAVQRTSELVPSTMTIGLNVRDVTASGAKFDVTPSNTDEVYFADVFVYDEYTAYDEGKGGLCRGLYGYSQSIRIIRLFALFGQSYRRFHGYARTVDDLCRRGVRLQRGTDDEDFRVGTFHHLRSGFGYGSENHAQPPSRFARRLPSGTPEHRETVVGRRRFSA